MPTGFISFYFIIFVFITLHCVVLLIRHTSVIEVMAEQCDAIVFVIGVVFGHTYNVCINILP